MCVIRERHHSKDFESDGIGGEHTEKQYIDEIYPREAKFEVGDIETRESVIVDLVPEGERIRL